MDRSRSRKAAFYILWLKSVWYFLLFSEDSPTFVIDSRHSVFTYLISYQASLGSVAHHLQIVSTTCHENDVMECQPHHSIKILPKIIASLLDS